MSIDIDRTEFDEEDFQILDSNRQLGWINRGDLKYFKIQQDYKHQMDAKHWLRIENNKLYPADNIKLFMITSNPVIALDDCLFYWVKV